MSDNGNNIFEKIIEDPVWADQMTTIYIRENVIEWIDKLLEFAHTQNPGIVGFLLKHYTTQKLMKC